MSPAHIASGFTYSFSGVGGPGTGAKTIGVGRSANVTGAVRNPASVGPKISAGDGSFTINKSIAANSNTNGARRFTKRRFDDKR